MSFHFPRFDELLPLHEALWRRDFPAASELLQKGAALDEILEDDGDSFLHRGAQEGDAEMVHFFLSRPCQKTLSAFDCTDMTPLIRAARYGQLEIVQLLIEAGVDVNANDESRIGNTAIREAVYGGHVEVVRALLKAGSDPTIPGWMQISAVGEAFNHVEGGLDSPNAIEIRKLFAIYPDPAWFNTNRQKPR